MSRALPVMVLALSILMCACFTGPSATGFRPATTAHGVESTIEVQRTRLAGELLEVSDSGYVLLSEGLLVFAPFSALRSASFSGIDSHESGRPDLSLMERLRLVSRYPKGMTPAVLDLLLAETHQTAVKVVRQ